MFISVETLLGTGDSLSCSDHLRLELLQRVLWLFQVFWELPAYISLCLLLQGVKTQQLVISEGCHSPTYRLPTIPFPQ